MDHVPSPSEVPLVFWALSRAAAAAAVTWGFYVAVEPFVRRFWPGALISWTRLLDGRLRDPLIGRHLLIGAAAGVLIQPLGLLTLLVERKLGMPGFEPPSWGLDTIGDLPAQIGHYAQAITNGFFMPVAILTAILLFRVVLRRNWLAVGTLWVVVVGINLLNAQTTLVQGALLILVFAIIFTLLFRFGLFCLLALVLFSSFEMFPVTLDPGSWYFGQSMLTLLLLAALAVYGFYISLAGKPVFRDVLGE
jgi:serine/threonine-protein kinase